MLGFLSLLGFNFAVLPLLVEVFGWPVLLPQLVILTVTAVYSWFAHRGFSFRRNPPCSACSSIDKPCRDATGVGRGAGVQQCRVH